MGTATENKMKIGTKAPAFNNLPGVDGKNYGLEDFSSNSLLVVIFACNHCPYVQAYEDRIIKLQADFKPKGVQFLVINSNEDQNYPDDSFENMVKRAKEKGFNYLYLRDSSQEAAKAFGATHTPQIFVFNQNRDLSYTGRIDDNWEKPEEVKIHYLKDAISNLLDGKKPKEPETFAIGCSIKWKQ